MTKDYIVRVYRFDEQKWILNMFTSLEEFKRSKARRDLIKCAVKTMPDTIALLYVQDNLVAQNIINHGSDSIFVVIHKEDYDYKPDYVFSERYPTSLFISSSNNPDKELVDKANNLLDDL